MNRTNAFQNKIKIDEYSLELYSAIIQKSAAKNTTKTIILFDVFICKPIKKMGIKYNNNGEISGPVK